MKRGRNKTYLLGHLGAAPDYREKGPTKYAKIRLIVPDDYLDPDTQQRVSRTEGFDIVFFGASATYLRDHGRKGRAAYVEAQLRNDRYLDEATGKRVTRLRLVGLDVELVDQRPVAVEIAPEPAPKPAPPSAPPTRDTAVNPFKT